uniref:Putative nuclease harbi1 n=1 Tax=Anopheles triannulatus TaxID=58253 RepID=A0A2M4AYR4_9DIPT
MRSVLRERNAQAGRLLEKVLEEDTDKTLISFIRMSREDFQYLLSWITPKIRKQDTNMRAAITARDKFIITLKFLAAGDCYNTHELNYRVSKQFELMIIN